MNEGLGELRVSQTLFYMVEQNWYQISYSLQQMHIPEPKMYAFPLFVMAMLQEAVARLFHSLERLSQMVEKNFQLRTIV